jgi:hypothetical protein
VPCKEEGEVDLSIPLIKGTFINRLAEEGFFGALMSDAKDLYALYKAPFEDELEDPDRKA